MREMKEVKWTMNLLLAEASADLQLQPGQCRRVQVNGYEVEIRRLPVEQLAFGDSVMLPPWVWFPDPPPAGTIAVHQGGLPLPDHPEIPMDEGPFE